MKCQVGDTTLVLGKGSVLLIPPFVSSSFNNAGDEQLTYYLFQFRSKKPMDTVRSNAAGGALIINYDSLLYTEKNGKGTRLIILSLKPATKLYS